MRISLIAGVVILLSSVSISAQSSEIIVNRVANHWLDLHNNFSKTADAWGNYTLDLTLESLLYYDHYTKSDSFTTIVQDVFRKRGISPADTIDYRTQPFCSINFTMGELTGNRLWYHGYIAESYRMKDDGGKSGEGAIMINHQGKYRILIDYMQEYASRMAKTGYLTGDSLLFSECIHQFMLSEALLKNDTTGLWCQGRGWCTDTTRLAEGAWSRGHGWLLRGIVTSMLYLPEEKRIELLPVLERISSSLLNVQAKNGMYHILLNLPVNKSAPDVSGTGMIAYYMAIAVKRGWLNEGTFGPSILLATNGMKEFVTTKGEVLNSCKGPGPLCQQEEYINYKPGIDEKHGFQGVIYGMIAEILMRD